MAGDGGDLDGDVVHAGLIEHPQYLGVAAVRLGFPEDGFTEQVHVEPEAVAATVVQVGGQPRRVGVDHQMAHQCPQPARGERHDDSGQCRGESRAHLQQRPVEGREEAGQRLLAYECGELARGDPATLGSGDPVHEPHGEAETLGFGDEARQPVNAPSLDTGLGPAGGLDPRGHLLHGLLGDGRERIARRGPAFLAGGAHTSASRRLVLLHLRPPPDVTTTMSSMRIPHRPGR